MNTMRTTITIRPSLLERLKIFARETKTPISEVFEQGATKVLNEHDQQHLQQMYGGLLQLSGMVQDPIADASTTINEVLYGEQGGWRGHAE